MFSHKKRNDARFRLIEADVQVALARPENEDSDNAQRIAEKFCISADAVKDRMAVWRRCERIRRMVSIRFR